MQTQQTQTRPSYTSAGAEVFTIQSDRMEEFWPVVNALLSLVENPDWTPEEVYESLVTKQSQCWGMAENGKICGIWITRIEKTSRGLHGLVWIVAGSGMTSGLEIYRTEIEPWFKHQGCRYVDIYGRKGWERVLTDYEFQTVQLRKYL